MGHGVNFAVTHDQRLFPLLLSLLLAAPPDTTVALDGPYLFYEGNDLVAQWVDTDRRKTGKLVLNQESMGELPAFSSFRPELLEVGRKFAVETVLRYANVAEVVAMSDIHGQYQTGRKLLEVNGIIDAEQHWTFGKGHLVIVGDVFDRGDQVTEMLWLIHNLQIEAERAGGKVHFLLGNHETLTLEGDERYLNQRYRVTTGMMGKFYRELYGRDTYLGRWLRSLPLAVQINETVYIHGGLSKEMVRQVSSLETLNKLYHENLIDTYDLQETIGSSRKMETMHGRMGPLWYRGYFRRNEFDGKDLTYVLGKIGAKRIVVGHTSFTAIQSFYDDRLIAVDSSIKFGSAGELLISKNDALYRATLTGGELPLERNETK